MKTPSKLFVLQRHIKTQEEQIKRLTETLARVESLLSQHSSECVPDSALGEEKPTQHLTQRTTGRRNLLKVAGIAALAAGAVALGQEPTTEAHSGDALLLGNAGPGNPGQTAENITGIQCDATGNVDVVFSVDGMSQPNGGSASVGIFGSASTNNTGIEGYCFGPSSFGLYGVTDSGYGVVAQSSHGISLWAGGAGRIFQSSSGFIGAPVRGSYFAGEQIRDDIGDLYICITSGTPGEWRRVAAGVPGASGAVNLLANPIRLLDTRMHNPFTAGSVHSVQVSGVVVDGLLVPGGAVGVIGNVTVVAPSSGGDLRIFPGANPPGASTINFAAGQTIANAVTVGLNRNGQVNIQVDMAHFAHTDVLFDASGYIL